MADLSNPKVQRILASTALAHLATVDEHGAPQSSPMWFLWDATRERILFTHTTHRKKYRNIRRDPRVAVSIKDVVEPYVHAEFRGVVDVVDPDPDGAFFDHLAERYGADIRWEGDSRVVLGVRVDKVVGQALG